MKRLVSGIMLTLFLTSMVILTFNVGVEESIHPSSARTYKETQGPASASEIIINQSQTWYGDFTVNATDTVIIEDSDFTVVNGIIQVYGSLIVKNSTLWMRSNTLLKEIWVYGNSSHAGNLSILDSEFTGNYISAISDWSSNIEILVRNSRMPTTLITGGGQYGTVNVSSSQLGQLYFYRENCSYFVSNSSIDRVNAEFNWPSVSPIFENSSINDFHIGSPHGVDLELRTGFIQSLSVQNQISGSSFTLHNCSVNHWYVDNPGDVGLANSEIEMVGLMVMAPSVPLDLTFENGSIQNYHLTIEQSGGGGIFVPIDLTVENTTIHDWDLYISDHNSTESTVRISDSNVSVVTFAGNDLNLVISNSTMKYGQFAVGQYSMGSLNLTLLDSNVTTFMPCYSVGSMNLTLQEGHQDFINLYNQEEGSNVTIINSEISHWGFNALGNVRANIYDTTMTGQGYAMTYVSGNANVSIRNSHLKRAFARRNSFLSVFDSSIDQLTCYDNANVTLVNSTITTLIIDPVQVTLIGSRILSEVHSSLPLDFNTAFLEQPPAPLPDNTYGVSKCLHVTPSSEDIFDAQIRIYYDAEEMAKQGISEGYLTMVCLEENSNSWQTCPIQGVNAADNFVWANVTHFSYFIVAWPYGWKLDFTVPTSHPIVDFAVYNGSLYAAADNKLYMKSGSSWNVIDAPAFVTSLEPYGGKLVVGGQGGLYSFNGTTFNLIFAVPTYIKALGIFNNTLYAGTFLDKPPTLYYCNGSADNPDNWHADTGFSVIVNFFGPFGSIDSFAEYNGNGYVTSGGTVYCYTETGWSIAKTYDDVYAYLDMQVYNGKLYLATRDQGWRKPMYLGGSGFSGRVIEFDGTSWTTVFDHDYWIYSLETYDNKLYVGTANKIYTFNGTDWETSFDAAEGAFYAISMTTYDGKVYVGMGNGYIFADPAPLKAEHETIVVPEFSSTTILAVFTAVTVLAAALTRKKRTKRFC